MAAGINPVVRDTLAIDFGACPPGCRECVKACEHERSIARINALDLPDAPFHGAITCLQCSEPACRDACPTGAIVQDEKGVTRLDSGRCVGCGACAIACEWGGISFDFAAGRAYKCDTCKGHPACAAACPTGALRWVETSALLRQYSEPDFFTHGASLCPGCAAELGFRLAFRVIGDDAIVFVAPGCACALANGFGDKATTKLPSVMSLMTNGPSLMTGVSRRLRQIGKKTRCVAFIGDGATADVGFQPLSGAAERRESVVYICYDNEGYMNTGVQRSGTTTTGARTMTTPAGPTLKGKTQQAKEVPLLMVFHGASYVATASIAYPEDFAVKVKRALDARDGLAYIHLYAPCHVGWESPMDSVIEISRRAVETRMFPLWEADHGRFRMTHPIERPRPIDEFTRLLGRFKHLGPSDLEALGKQAEDRYHRIEALCAAMPVG